MKDKLKERFNKKFNGKFGWFVNDIFGNSCYSLNRFIELQDNINDVAYNFFLSELKTLKEEIKNKFKENKHDGSNSWVYQMEYNQALQDIIELINKRYET